MKRCLGCEAAGSKFLISIIRSLARCPGQASHDEGLVKGSHHGGIETSPIASVSKVQAHLRDAARFRARSTSHAVAAHSSCTKIPLSAGRAQEDENLSRKRRFRPRFASVRPPGSVRTDHVPRITVLDAWKTGLSSGGPNQGAFDHDSGAHIFPERDQQLSRQRHDRCLAPTTAVTFHSVLEPEGECRARLMA